MKIPENIVFATNNAHKLQEAREILGSRCHVMSLADIGCFDDIEETSLTLEGNALIKARWVKQKYEYDCFADDTGLEVETLGGAPGVHSARYAAIEEPGSCHHDTKANTRVLLKNLEGKENRRARFRTAIVLITGSEEHLFEGIVEGHIIEEMKGEEGFGYDPVFIPEGEQLTFAEMGQEKKNSLSHRSRALHNMMKFFI